MKDLTSEQIIRNFKLYILTDVESDTTLKTFFIELQNKFKNLKKYIPDNEFYNYLEFYGETKNDIYILKRYDGLFIDNALYSNFTSYYHLDKLAIIETTNWYVKNMFNILTEIDTFNSERYFESIHSTKMYNIVEKTL